MRNEAYLSYAAVTKDAAQRSIRTFYDAVKDLGELQFYLIKRRTKDSKQACGIEN